MVDASRPDHPAMPHRRPPFTRRQILAQIGVAAVILISGIGIGSGGTILALKDRIIPRLRLLSPNPAPVPGPEPNFLVDRWREEYSLSDKQAEQVKEILTSQWKATRDLWEKFNQAQIQEREKFSASMKKILTSEQFAKWEDDLKKRFEHFRGGRPFDGRGGGRGGPRGERRPDWSPDRGGMEPNDWRGGRPPGPWDPNSPRGDWQRNGRRGDGSRGFRDPNSPRGFRPPERFMDPNSPPADLPKPQ